jgi:hypothetical protein
MIGIEQRMLLLEKKGRERERKKKLEIQNAVHEDVVRR